MSQSANNKRIAKNTLLLYVRMLFSMLVSLFTSRVVLQTLGVEDYGIYNVVGGFVSMLIFINSSMATSTQRFLNYEMGKGDFASLRSVFSNAVNAHYLIGIFTVLVLESAGLWFLYNELNIPAEKFDAAVWVFHFSVLSMFVSIISTPYNAAIIANEKMGIYAYFSIIEVVLKLLIVYLLLVIPYNKLMMYGLMQLLVGVLMRVLYGRYCIKKFKECKYQFVWQKGLMYKMFTFSGWMLFGCVTDMLSKQGVNILINIFFGPVYNASRGVAIQVHHSINHFVANFMTAVRPQIVKSYSAGNLKEMYKLVFAASRISYYLLFLLTFPVILYADFILDLWLDVVPEYCTIFTRLVLLELLVTSAYSPIAQINQASGRVRNYQMAVSVLFLLSFLLTYSLFKLGYPVYWAFIVSVLLAFVGLLVRVYILRKENNFPAQQYLLKVMLPLLPVSMISMCIPVAMKLCLPVSAVNILFTIIISLFSSVFFIWFWGLRSNERRFILDKVKSVYLKIKR